MLLKFILLIIFLYCSLLNSNAQRVVRKGVTENQAKQKQSEAKYSLSQLQGKWQEVKRITVASLETISFSDSLLLNFLDEKVEVKDATSMRISMNGDAQIDAPDILSVAGDVYTIRSVSTNKLVIDDGEFTREMQKKDQFYYETLRKIPVEKDSVSVPVTIDINNLKGKWLVYARKAKPGSVTALTPVIKSIEINSISADGIAFGEIVYYTSNISKIISCKLVTKDGVIKIITDKDTWSFNAYKADGKEFIFGETDKLVYYLKQ